MTDHFNKLTPAQAERLAILAEECGEVIQAIGKILRHGYESRNPFEPHSSNRQNLEKECGDVSYAIRAIANAGDIDSESIARWERTKEKKVKPYLHHQETP